MERDRGGRPRYPGVIIPAEQRVLEELRKGGTNAEIAGPLLSCLYGFWQSHLGRKRHNTKHGRAWVSEITGWQPASTEPRVLGLKGDPLNLSTDEVVTSNPDDGTLWDIGGAEGPRRSQARFAKFGAGGSVRYPPPPC